jgi:AcrR family transcriptional regulator
MGMTLASDDPRDTPRTRAKAAAGVSGPAVYRHFPGKQSVLAALLVDVSQDLVDGGTLVIGRGTDAAATLRALIDFHVDFALRNADVIRVQDRDLESLADAEQHSVRALQRAYVELWVGVLARLDPGAAPRTLRVKAHAAFGLINSTPHSGHSAATGEILGAMAWAALTA